MDPIRIGFIQIIIDFVESLPPLLQLILGIFITLGMVKVLLIVADFIQDKREEKK